MADYYTSFSCLFDVGTAEHAVRATELYQQQADQLEEDDGIRLRFDMEPDPANGPGVLWIRSDGDGEPEHVIEFVKLCAEAFGLQGKWGFWWSLSCSRMRLDGFGGGAHVIDLDRRETIAWMDCEHWVADQLASDPATPGAPA